MPQLTEIQSQIAQTNWACLVNTIRENFVLVAKTAANHYLQLQQPLPVLPPLVQNPVTVPAPQQQLPKIAG